MDLKKSLFGSKKSLIIFTTNHAPKLQFDVFQGAKCPTWKKRTPADRKQKLENKRNPTPANRKQKTENKKKNAAADRKQKTENKKKRTRGQKTENRK